MKQNKTRQQINYDYYQKHRDERIKFQMEARIYNLHRCETCINYYEYTYKKRRCGKCYLYNKTRTALQNKCYCDDYVERKRYESISKQSD